MYLVSNHIHKNHDIRTILDCHGFLTFRI